MIRPFEEVNKDWTFFDWDEWESVRHKIGEDKFEEIKAGNVTEESVKELKDLAEAGIITKDIYAKVLEENPALNEYLN